MVFIISYAFHVLGSALFFTFIPFPYLIKGTLSDKKGHFSLLLRIYRRLFWLAHGILVVSLVSGFLLSTNWASTWFIIVLVIWVIIGLYVGLGAKMIRVILEKIENNQDADLEIAKLRQYSLLLSFTVIAMFAAKIMNYF
ncbi:hypothetical protein GN156_00520 [bacterium LRH843]|nr:hypothetical protein [bacterium LRH843]